MVLQCNACGATYVDEQPDGTRYFHACAPLAGHEIRAGLADGSVSLTKAQQAQLAALDNAAPVLTAKPGDPTPGDVYLSRLTIERPNKRDENVRIAGKDDDGKQILVATLEGAGVTELV